MKLNKLQQAVAGAVLILIVFLLTQFVILKGDKAAIIATDKKISDLEQNIRVAEAIQETAAELEEENLHLRSQLDRLKKILPVTINKPKFVADVKRYSNENGIEIIEVVHNKPIVDDVIVEHPFTFRTRGNYHDLGFLFSQLTNYQRIVNIKGLSLTRRGAQDYSVSSHFLVSIYTYNEPTEEELKKQIEAKKQAHKNKGKKKRRR